MAQKYQRLLLLQEQRKPKPPTPGNAAALRAALEIARDLILPQCNGGTAFARACGEVVNKIMTALAEPPRNCDMFATAYDALKEWHGGLETAEDIARMVEWLLAPAQEGVAK